MPGSSCAGLDLSPVSHRSPHNASAAIRLPACIPSRRSARLSSLSKVEFSQSSRTERNPRRYSVAVGAYFPSRILFFPKLFLDHSTDLDVLLIGRVVRLSRCLAGKVEPAFFQDRLADRRARETTHSQAASDQFDIVLRPLCEDTATNETLCGQKRAGRQCVDPADIDKVAAAIDALPRIVG